jgi:ribosomal protein S16
MPLPKVLYSVDQFNDGRFIVTKVVDGTPVEEVGKYRDVEEAKREAINLQAAYITNTLFPGEDGSDELITLIDSTRNYFQDLLRLLPQNGDSTLARSLVRQAYNYARSSILMDGLV